MKSFAAIFIFLYCLFLTPVAGVAQETRIAASPATILLEDSPDFNFEMGLKAVQAMDQIELLDLNQARQRQDWQEAGDGTILADLLYEGNRAYLSKAEQVWIYSRVKNTENTAIQWYINTRVPAFKDIKIYALRQSGQVDLLIDHKGEDGYEDRPIQDPLITAKLSLESQENAEIYFQYTGVYHDVIAPIISSEDYYLNERNKEVVFTMLYMGSTIAACIFAVLLGSFFGFRISLTFAGYLLSALGLYLGYSGRIIPYFTPDNPDLSVKLEVLTSVSLWCTALLFGHALMNIKTIAPRYNRIIWLFIFYSSFFALVTLVTPLTTTHVALNMLAAVTKTIALPLAVTLHVTTCLLGLIHKQKGAIAFSTSAIILAGLALYNYFTLYTDYSLADYYNLQYLLVLAVILDGTAFAIAMAVRASSLKKERNQAVEAELEAMEQQVMLSQKLRVAEDDYRRVSQQSARRRDTLESVSHDLLQPLTALRSNLSENTLQDKDRAIEMNQALDYLEALARDNLKAKSSIEEMATVNLSEKFDIKVVTDNVFQMFKAEAQSKGLSFRYRPPIGKINSNPVDLMRILSNLVSNAIKHTEEGGVLIGSRNVKDGLKIEIWDTGPGLNQVDIDKFLKPYEKSETSNGNGLGLHLVKEMCREQGCKFSMKSKLGKGTVTSIFIKRQNQED